MLAAGPAARADERPKSAVTPAGIPTLAQLEEKGATIGTVTVYVQNIFDPRDAREDHAIFRAANALHYPTREKTVRNSLLFASGDRFVAHQLAETERILRGRVYLNDAWIVPVAYDAEHNTVDLAVTVRDVWTLDPGLSLGRSGGKNASKVQLEEENLFGLGTDVQISRARNVDRVSDTFNYTDLNFLGSWWQLMAEYSDNSDGSVKSLSAIRPFYALDTRQAGGLLASQGTSIVSRYERGQIVDQFDETHNQAQAYLGGSQGLKDGWSERWYVGARYDQALFTRLAAPTLQPAVLPTDRTLAYPWFGWQLIEDKYTKTSDLDLIGRTEDAYVGRSIYAELGYASPTFGAATRSWLTQVNALAGWQSEDRRYLFMTATLSGRVDDGTLRNVNLTAGGRYFDRVSSRQMFFMSLTGTVTRRLDGDQQLLLGGDNGLRGYPLRFQGGTSSALFTVEHRVYTDWYPFRLFRVGGAVFFDAGRTWGRDFTGAAPLGMLKDAGVGLRFGNNRSGLGNVVHVDFSYAFDAPTGTRNTQVTVQTTQKF